jgi:hypothetical protein
MNARATVAADGSGAPRAEASGKRGVGVAWRASAALCVLGAALLGGCEGVLIEPGGSGPGAGPASGAGAAAGAGPGAGGTGGSNPNDPGNAGTGPTVPAGPSAAPLRRLTTREFHNTVRDLFAGIAIPDQSFPPPVSVGGFENNELSLPPTSLLTESEYRAADAIATAVVAQKSSWVPCGTSDAACARQTADALIDRAYRRPPTTAERDRIGGFVEQSLTASDFDTALHDLVQAVLLSPQFLFRVELGRTPGAGATLVDLDDYELASRLSYLLWQTMPDQALFAAAAAGKLADAAALKTQAERLLADPRAHAVVRDFHRQWLELDRLDRLTLDASRYPELNEALRTSYRKSLESFVDWAFWDQRSVGALFATDQVFADAALSPILGVNVTQSTPLRVAAPNRNGLLTQPGLLASTSHGTLHSPVFRGILLLRKFLCFTIPPPPPEVMTNLDPIPEGAARTTREHFELTHRRPDCASCHDRIDPAGYTLENYDALGRYVTTENGVAVDSSGGLPIGSSRDTKISGGMALGDALSQASEVRSCLANHWFRFAFGRLPSDASDRSEVVSLAKSIESGPGDPEALLLALVQSTSFRKRPASTTP